MVKLQFLFHFVSLVFRNQLLYSTLGRNLVSRVSFVSHNCETKQVCANPLSV